MNFFLHFSFLFLEIERIPPPHPHSSGPIKYVFLLVLVWTVEYFSRGCVGTEMRAFTRF